VRFKRLKREEARTNLERALHDYGENPTALVCYHLAEVYYDLGRDVDAQRMVRDALRLDAGNRAAQILSDRLQNSPHQGKGTT
jgi:tetratricopeptide (TPR) repeat protein